MSQGASLPVPALPTQWRAIVFADLAESVRLIQNQGFAMVERWRRFVALSREQVLAARGGRLVRTAGDGLLIECADAAKAMAVALGLHEAAEADNRSHQGEPAMQFRVGVHYSEVAFDEHEAYGAGVNLAARIAAMAQPGQTLVSAEVRAGLGDGVDADLEDLGLQFLKHVDVPQRLFRASRPGEPQSRPACPSPGADLRPLLAVVPFVAHPPDAVHDAFGHALADELITALARHPGLRVMSRMSSGTLRHAMEAADGFDSLRRLHHDVDLAYVLGGRFYLLGDQARVSIELSALPEGEVLWSAQQTVRPQDLFAGNDALVPEVVRTVNQFVAAHELLRVRSLPMGALAPYTLYLGACGLLHSLVQSDFRRARDVLEHLIERHPREAAPLAMLARWHVFLAAQGWSDDRERDGLLASQWARRALDIDPNQAVAHAALAQVKLNFEADVAASRHHAERAIQQAPQEGLAWSQLSASLAFQGAHDQAERAAAQALAVSPFDPDRYLFESYAAMASLATERYSAAADLARQSLRRHTLHAPSHRLLVAALWLQGEHDAASGALRQFKHHCPQARAAPSPSLRALGGAWRARYEDALREAGLAD